MNNYSEIIDIFASGVDLRAVAIEVAKGQPSAFVAAHKRMMAEAKKREAQSLHAVYSPSDEWRAEARALMKMGEYLRAYKLCREHTGMSLVGARAYCASLV